MTVALLNWTAPVVDVDGNPLPSGDVVNYNVYDTVGGAAAVVIGTTAGTMTTFKTGHLVPGVHMFQVAAVDGAGNVGTLTAPVSATVPAAAPGAPTNLTVSLQAS